MKINTSTILSLVAFVLLLNISCTNNDPAPVALTAVTFKDLNADYAPQVFGAGQPTRPTQKKKYTFFSFKTGQIMPNAIPASDSASTKWDIAFQGTSIIVNSGTSGPGSAEVIVQQGVFSTIKSVPTTGYTKDNYNYTTKTGTFAISSSPLASGAIPTNQWWYNSNTPTSTVVSPIAGQVFIIKTTDGRYAKMEIQSFYRGAPTTVDNMLDLDRHYTFRYVYQPNGTTTF